MYRKILSHFYKQVEENYAYAKSFSQKWDLFEKKNTYLTSKEQDQFKFPPPSYYSHIIDNLLSLFLFDESHKNMLLERNKLINDLQKRIESYNDLFIERRLREYMPLFEGEHLNAPLDREQRKAVIVDDQYNLIVAAAGSGKTSVLTSRIAYLVRRTDAIAKNKILALAFNKSAAQEMKKRLKSHFDIEIDIGTFHSFGHTIVKENGIQVSDIKSTTELIDELFPHLLKTNHRLQQLFIEYMSNYLQEGHTAADFQTREEYFQYMNNQRYITLSGRKVKSLAEKEIANFFFIHDIDFEYEKRVTWIPQHPYKSYHPDFYLPQYDIYIEHWGLDRNGQTAPWIDEEEYKKTRQWKLAMFQQYGRVLIETWEYERTEETLIDHLKYSLQRINPQIQFQQIPYTELVNRVYAPLQEETRAVKKLLSTVITHAKSHFLKPSDLEHRLQTNIYKQKTHLFGEIALLIYQDYEKYLKDHKLIDFHDMINKAIDLVKANPQKYFNRYDHILIDEFQDISHQLLTLIKCFVHDDTDTKLFCVGDDWQSIYQFTGSETTFFIKFEQYFMHPSINYLQTNYRSSKSIVDASTHLISYNTNQRRKYVQAHNTFQEAIHLYTIKTPSLYNNYNHIQAKHVCDTINNLLKNGEKPEEILVISRFNKPLRALDSLLHHTDALKYRKIRLQTVHQSKGSEAAHVFILSVISDLYGFPAELEDNVVLEIVKPPLNKTELFEEERRLFYVALTRSKRHIYMYTQEGKPSIFLKEIDGYFEVQTIASDVYSPNSISTP